MVLPQHLQYNKMNHGFTTTYGYSHDYHNFTLVLQQYYWLNHGLYTEKNNMLYLA